MNIEEEIRKALNTGVEPNQEVKLYLTEFFDTFSPDLQNELVDRKIVRKQRCEVWSRVMGYFRPVDQWNKGKKQEHRERHHLSVDDAASFNEGVKDEP